MNDKDLLDKLIEGDPSAVREFFFVRMKEAFAYIGRFYSPEPMSAEEIVGEAYEVLSKDNWHKLRLFKGTCKLTTYVTVIVARHFQHKRNLLIGVDDNALTFFGGKEAPSDFSFVMADVREVLAGFKPLDRLLLQRVMLDGEKPGDILDEVRQLIIADEDSTVGKHDDAKLAGYVYLRYHRAKVRFRGIMEERGYGR